MSNLNSDLGYFGNFGVFLKFPCFFWGIFVINWIKKFF